MKKVFVFFLLLLVFSVSSNAFDLGLGEMTSPANPFTILAGQSVTITANFAPLTAAAFAGSVTATWPNQDSPLVASLSGTGVAAGDATPTESSTQYSSAV